MKYNNSSRISIKGWSVEERPQEKLVNLGSGGVSTAELLAIIIGNGTREESAVELSRKLLSHFDNSLHKIESASLAELMKIKGIGFASATKILSAFILGRRHRSEVVTQQTKIMSSQSAWEVIQPFLSGINHEEFWISLVNRANFLIKTIQISKGGLAGTVVDIKKIYSLVAEYRASGLLLYHNHPSGSVTPSEQDKTLTEKICQLAKVMEVQILDHLIVGDEKYFSFADHGLI